jgi:hypothetical protein
LTCDEAPGALLARARELGLSALALCDVDTTAGLVELLQASRQEAVRPILGAEISEPQPDGRPGRVIALVRDEAGYRNLCRLVSARRLGDDPGAPEEPLQGGSGDLERFDLASAVERFQAGLTFLVDHPRLVYALAPRLARRRLLVAIAPAALAKRATGDARRVGPGGVRNAYLAQGIRGPRNFAPSLAPTRHGGRDGERAAKTVRSAAGDASERAIARLLVSMRRVHAFRTVCTRCSEVARHHGEARCCLRPLLSKARTTVRCATTNDTSHMRREALRASARRTVRTRRSKVAVQTDVGATTGPCGWRACTVLRGVSRVEGANQTLKRRTDTSCCRGG